MAAPTTLNQVWALDFMHDALYGGRAVRILNVIDEANREALAVEVGTSIPAARVVRVLDQLIEMHGVPASIRCDNGPEFTSSRFADWCEERKIEIRYIQPGKPDQNAYIERFNRTYRGDVLDAWLFASVAEMQELSDEWLADYNENRPHDSLGGMTPFEFLPRPTTPALSSFEVCA
jgi:putative transposase